MLLLCTLKFTQTSIDVDKKCLYSFEYQPASTNCQTPSIRRVNAKNIAWCIAQKNAVQSLVPTCAFWLSAHMVANYMAWSLKIPDKLVDAYIHLALNQSARQGCSILVEPHKIWVVHFLNRLLSRLQCRILARYRTKMSQ